ncbi:hypothetical protein BGW36DRAFT_430233 [Talaromyces proteolyticus]|uniref:Pectate lyase n=1 Tax=Talaromyces proteolyticus TaxID=1131652 RepID=A0AAD4KR54_9EURO|nr:uncharacterized protein BGW36DRAFT_430233 [Talaromyces proteolyticus]KAH8694214.1 hypothetical protein BGW36DRAFT_430233 [Talaromyces proteolyticus]
MYNLKFLTVAVFLLVSQVFAGRVTYTAYDKTGGISKKGKWEQKAGGSIPDDKDDDLIQNIGVWSSHQYTAARNARSGVIIVKAVQEGKNKNEATTLNNRGQQIVNEHIK